MNFEKKEILNKREYLWPFWPTDVWPADDILFCSVHFPLKIGEHLREPNCKEWFENKFDFFFFLYKIFTYTWFGTKTKILIKQKLVLSFHDYQNKDILPVQCTVSNWHKSAVGGLIHLVTDTSGVNSFNMENRNRDSHSIQILHIRMYVYIFISISAVKDHKTPGLLGVIKLT